MNQKISLAALGLAVIAVIAVVFGGAPIGGLIEPENPIFTNGLRGGNPAAQIVDSNASVVAESTGRFQDHGSVITADTDLTKAQAQAAGFYRVDTSSNAVSIGLPDLDTEDIGKELTFIVSTGHATNSVETYSVSGTTVTIGVLNATTDDAGDRIHCKYIAADSVNCLYYAQD